MQTENIIALVVVFLVIAAPAYMFKRAKNKGKGLIGQLFSGVIGLFIAFFGSMTAIGMLSDSPSTTENNQKVPKKTASQQLATPPNTAPPKKVTSAAKKSESSKFTPVFTVGNITISDPKNSLRRLKTELSNCTDNIDNGFLSSFDGTEITCVMTYAMPKGSGFINPEYYKAIYYDGNGVRLGVYEFPTQNINPGESIKTTLIYHYPLSEVARVVICDPYTSSC